MALQPLFLKLGCRPGRSFPRQLSRVSAKCLAVGWEPFGDLVPLETRRLKGSRHIADTFIPPQTVSQGTQSENLSVTPVTRASQVFQNLFEQWKTQRTLRQVGGVKAVVENRFVTDGCHQTTAHTLQAI